MPGLRTDGGPNAAQPHTLDGEPVQSPVAPLVHATLQEQTYQRLRKAIREGRFVSGQPLTVRGLAALLGVSPMPVREAVRRLSQDGTIEFLPNRTMRVPLLTPRRFEELADIRAELEGFAAGRAAERMSEIEFAAIKAAHENMSRAVDIGDMATVNLMNERFHFSIYRSAGSDTLVTLIENLWQQSGPYLASLIHLLFGASGRPTSLVLAHHYAVLAALSRRDSDASREAMRVDIIESARWYRSSLGDDQRFNAVDRITP